MLRVRVGVKKIIITMLPTGRFRNMPSPQKKKTWLIYILTNTIATINLCLNELAESFKEKFTKESKKELKPSSAKDSLRLRRVV
jgi:hypothetical protein